MCLCSLTQNGANTEHPRSPDLHRTIGRGECEWPQGKASVKKKVKEGVRGGNKVAKVDD